jgi:hypothetical protein
MDAVWRNDFTVLAVGCKYGEGGPASTGVFARALVGRGAAERTTAGRPSTAEVGRAAPLVCHLQIVGPSQRPHHSCVAGPLDRERAGRLQRRNRGLTSVKRSLNSGFAHGALLAPGKGGSLHTRHT